VTSSVRCAIYTRKSTEEGLEQEFNSLDAQREACAAYILSQRHEGWSALSDRYEDGGFSGGNMNRPGLIQLLADVKAGKVDVIVVYKVDRLTRSLADFAKMVEVLDGAGASFVSVTQALNTTTSMGRLTLNVLLSFAQFEREVTGERIRDKIAASRKMGMWMGGTPPLGYDVKDRQLVINAEEAATVRSIFEGYLAAGSIRALVAKLRGDGVRTKRVGSRGAVWFGRGSLNHLLKNPLYIGQVRYKGDWYAGQHQPIVDQALWDDVQAALRSQTAEQPKEPRTREPSLLAGLLYDAEGRRLAPTYGVKKGVRYRYYVTAEGHDGRPERALRFSAPALEKLVVDRLVEWLEAASERLSNSMDAQLIGTLLHDAKDDVEALRAGTSTDQRNSIRQLVGRIVVGERELELHVLARDGSSADRLRVALGRVRRGNDVRLLVKPSGSPATPLNEELVQILADAKAAQQLAMARPELDLPALAKLLGRSDRVFKRLLRLSYLAPGIVGAALSGTQPLSLTCRALHRVTGIPVSWDEQLAQFGCC